MPTSGGEYHDGDVVHGYRLDAATNSWVPVPQDPVEPEGEFVGYQHGDLVHGYRLDAASNAWVVDPVAMQAEQRKAIAPTSLKVPLMLGGGWLLVVGLSLLLARLTPGKETTPVEAVLYVIIGVGVVVAMLWVLTLPSLRPSRPPSDEQLVAMGLSLVLNLVFLGVGMGAGGAGGHAGGGHTGSAGGGAGAGGGGGGGGGAA